MTFLEPCKKDEYFGTGQFHLRLLKTIPAQPQKKYLPAYLFEMVANGQPVGRCGSDITTWSSMREISAMRWRRSIGDITMLLSAAGCCCGWQDVTGWKRC